jgi:ferrous iron transport protein B
MTAETAGLETAPLTTGAIAVALVGNPNSGKTTLFNALTGLRQKVGNYPGVTVEKKEGRCRLPAGTTAKLLDLPGLYSLTPHSPDETIAREVLMGLRSDTDVPDVVLNVVDASNLERNLYLTGQLLDLGIPTIVALTMTDAAEQAGIKIDAAALSKQLHVPVIVVVASQKVGIQDVLRALESGKAQTPPPPAWDVPDSIQQDLKDLTQALVAEYRLNTRFAFVEALTLLMQQDDRSAYATEHLSDAVRRQVKAASERLAEDGVDFASVAIAARYAWIESVSKSVCALPGHTDTFPITSHDKIDRIVMHPIFGYLLFFGLMAVMFQAIFTLGQAPADFIKDKIRDLGELLARHMADGDLKDLIRSGVLGGVGTTLSFLPQILLLFFFVSLLEDTGYMARAAFLMDRLMSKVGLHGKSFIPLLSSFACAIPGIMATRTIGDRKARLITILVAPLMSCSARLPVYLLMTSAFVPNRAVINAGHITLMTLPGLTFVSMYFLGMIAAFLMAGLFHKTLLKGVSPTFMLELPPYRMPGLRAATIQMLERAGLFVRRASTVILTTSVVLWGLATFPRTGSVKTPIGSSYVGKIGHTIEPAIRPLGFDWKMGIGIVSSFVAREIFVSSMGTVYNIDDAEGDDKTRVDLGEKMRAEVSPVTGKKVYTPLVAVCLMIYYVLAMQCMSTVAVVRRETNGWKWPIFQIGYMTGLAWIVTFIVYHVGQAMGWGV